MIRYRFVGVFLLLALFLEVPVWSVSQGSSQEERERIKTSTRVLRKVKPLHQKKLPNQPGDWLENHKEKGQTFQQYYRTKPISITEKRNVLYVLPLGRFERPQTEVVELSAQFLGLYFSCETRILDTLSLEDVIPAEARRVHPAWGVRQIRTGHILEKVLPARVPDDAVALICLTTSDLYPEDDWNFVFGQAMFRDRVGVWSMFRNGDPKSEFKQVLRRTLRIATHETGHMFSIPHCTAYECNMCGSNGMAESDRLPLYLCPECVAKVIWSTRCEPGARFRKLRDFCVKHDLDEEAKYYQQAIETLR